MTAKELAQRITGRHYMEELSEEEEILANKNGLIVVFGASDDLMELLHQSGWDDFRKGGTWLL